MTPQVSATDLATELNGDNPPTVLDVREPEEVEVGILAGALHIPIGQIVNRRFELDPTKGIVVVCTSGMRSAEVTEYLLDNGFGNVRNLVGGMIAWANDVDPAMKVF